MWVLGHTGICGNEVADRAAKEALENDLMPFTDLKPLTAKYIHQVWQKEWDEAVIVSNKLHEILPKLSDRLLSLARLGKKTQFQTDFILVILI